MEAPSKPRDPVVGAAGTTTSNGRSAGGSAISIEVLEYPGEEREVEPR